MVYLPRVRFKPKGRHPHQCNWPRGPTQVNREQSQGRTPQNPRKNREQLRPRQLSQNENSGSDGDMSDQTEPVAPRKYRNRVPRPNSDQPVSNAKSKIVQIMNMLHGFIAVRNVNSILQGANPVASQGPQSL